MKDWYEFDFTGKKILLIEDHPVNVFVETKLLEKVGVEVVSAENGKIGVEKYMTALSGEYSAILMDVNMPIMDGITAAQKIRDSEKEDAKTIPIIALTTNYLEEDIQRTLAAGMNAHLVKPIEPQNLMICLKKCIDR